jgi:predicted heme/steroid binding protein
MFILIIVLVLMTLVACDVNNNESMENENEKNGMVNNKEDNDAMNEEKVVMDEMELELTLEELKAFDGKNGNKAYVAVDGVIYDMSNSSLWKEGGHNGFEAGQDLTDAIMNKSPHGIKMLDRVPIVGKIVE